MPKDSNNSNLGSSGFGPDVTKSDKLASGTMPSSDEGNATNVIPPKSRTNDSVQADFDKNCECCS